MFESGQGNKFCSHLNKCLTFVPFQCKYTLLISKFSGQGIHMGFTMDERYTHCTSNCKLPLEKNIFGHLQKRI